MPAPETRAQAVAERLAAATGAEARVRRTPDAIRVEVDVPAELSESALGEIVAALVAADRYGHDVTGRADDAGVAWAEIILDTTDREETP